MSQAEPYLVIARKYRPQVFGELVGQDHVVRTLQNAIRSGRISHAYIFSGTRGVGKTTTARIMAKAINCHQGPSPEPCNACVSCREIQDGRSLDVLEFDAATHTQVDKIREVIENLKFAPARDRNKIYIIDEVHMLSASAFNALLKTLEEPPGHVIFMMATTAPEKIPVTIRSRCQCFDFRLLSRDEIIAHLEMIVEREGLRLGAKVLRDVARAAEGSLRDAQSLLDQVISFVGPDAGEEQVEEVLHLVRGEVLERFLRAVAGRDAGTLLRIIDELAARGFDMRRFLQEVTEWIRGMMLVSVSPDLAALIPLAAEEQEAIAGLAGSFPAGRLQALVTLALEAERDLKNASSTRYAMEVVALRMAQTADFDTLDGLVRRLEGLAGSGGGRDTSPPGGAAGMATRPPAAEGKKAPPVTANSLPAPTDDDGGGDGEEDEALELENPATPAPPDEWQRFVERVKQRKIGLGSFLEHGCLVSRDERAVVIGFSRQNTFFLESARDDQQLLQEIADEFFGRRHLVRLQLLEEEGGGERAPQPRATDLMKKRRKEALENPLVQEVIDTFGGTVTDVRIINTLSEEGG